MAKITRQGFGQVEPNHLSAQRTAQIYAQLPAHMKVDGATAGTPAAAPTIKVLENGQFVKYDYPNKEVNFTGDGEWMLVYNEIKLYDDWRETYKDWAMQLDNYTPGSTTITHGGLGPFPGQMTPRVFKTNVGDIFTTNALYHGNTSGNAMIDDTDAAVTNIQEGDLLAPTTASNGFLVAATGNEDMVWQVAKVYTLPDGQPAVKVMRIK